MTGSTSGPASLPEGWTLDPVSDQPLADLDIWYVITSTGRRTAWNGDRVFTCPVCFADPEKMPDCVECAGRGETDHIPYADRPFDEIIPNLWLGGHACQPSESHDGEVIVTDQDGFDLVVSLAYIHGYGPGLRSEHHQHRMADAELDPEHHSKIDELAEVVSMSVQNGRKTLVRCLAGLNRSGLVAALAMLRLGYSSEEALRLMREKRSPYVLFNQSFVDYIKEKEKQ